MFLNPKSEGWFRRLWGAALLVLGGPAWALVDPGGTVTWADDLKQRRDAGRDDRFVLRGGEFTPEGWRMIETRGYLRVDLGPEGAPEEGELQVTVTGLDGPELARRLGPDQKIHLLNLFSNGSGDHHAESGGQASDALWTIRAGTDAGMGLRYGGDLKLLWASRGAKRTAGSDYQEARLQLPEGWRWRGTDEHKFRVSWSQERGELIVRFDKMVLGTFAWKRRGDRLRYVFLGGAADFRAWPGATFRNLVIRRFELGDASRAQAPVFSAPRN